MATVLSFFFSFFLNGESFNFVFPSFLGKRKKKKEKKKQSALGLKEQMVPCSALRRALQRAFLYSVLSDN